MDQLFGILELLFFQDSWFILKIWEAVEGVLAKSGESSHPYKAAFANSYLGYNETHSVTLPKLL